MVALLPNAELRRPRGPARRTVLVVEDDQLLCELLVFLLELEGYAAVVARDGRAALQLARELQPALISLDLGLPLLSGQEVLDELAAGEETREIPVVIFSSDVEGLRPTSQVSRVLLKPGGIQQFAGAVNASLAGDTAYLHS